MQITNNLLDIEDVKKSRLPLINLFIRKTAVLTSVSEHITELVIKDQWSHANKQTREDSSIGEIDFPNLGTLFISNRKAENRIKNLDSANRTLNTKASDTELTEKEREKAKEQVERNNNTIRSLKLKSKKDGV